MFSNTNSINENSISSRTVSSFCHSHFITISLNEKVASAIASVRRCAQPGHIFYLYVIDERAELRGVVSIRSLLLAGDEVLVSQIYSEKVVSLQKDSPIRLAYEVFAKSRFLSLPVVDEQRRMLGIVHAHEIVGDFNPARQESLLEDSIRRELFELLGIKAEDGRQNPGWIAVGRLPWLMVNIVGGSLCAFLIHRLGSRLTQAVEFLAFVPVLLVVSESIGMQTASLAIANLHRASSRIQAGRLLLREWAVASLLGIACALILSSALYFIQGSSALALAVAASVLLGCLVVSFVGNVIPILFHRWKIDPRVAAGPVVLSLADFSTLLFYLGIALLLTRTS